MAHQVGDDIERFGQVFVQHLNVVADQFFRSERVQPTADGIDRAGNLLGGTVLGSLEHHVLNEVGDPALFIGFFARTRSNPDAYRNTANVRHTFADDSNPVRENGALYL